MERRKFFTLFLYEVGGFSFRRLRFLTFWISISGLNIFAQSRLGDFSSRRLHFSHFGGKSRAAEWNETAVSG